MAIEVLVKRKNDVIISPTSVKIVRLLSLGYETAEISNKLQINQRTLEGKILLMKKEIGCKTLSHLVGFFFRNNLIK